MGRGREVSFNVLKCFSAFVKISPRGKFKTTKAVLTIVIGLKNIVHWNLVKSALDKEDKNVPMHSPFFISFNLSFQCMKCSFNNSLHLWIIWNACNMFNRK